MKKPDQADPELPAPVLELVNVSVPDGSSTEEAILENVNWRIEAGEFWFVGGLHQSGKTDLLMVAAGLIPALAGTCRLFGSEELPRPRSVRVRVGVAAPASHPRYRAERHTPTGRPPG